MTDLEIKVIPTSKHDIKQLPLAEEGYLPRHPFRLICCGRSGSGKTMLVLNLIQRFFKDYYDYYIISPTAGELDDSYEVLELPKEHFFHPENAVEVLERLFEIQEEKIDEKGIDGVKPVLVVFDDTVSYPITKEPQFVRTFVMCRHYGMSLILNTQSWNRLVPRPVRLQASHVALFAAPLSEVEIFTQEYCAPGYTKRKFIREIYEPATDGYNFLYVDTTLPLNHPVGRYRKNLTENLIKKNIYIKGKRKTKCQDAQEIQL